MGTIHIHSNKPDDLYILNELAKRMNLKSNIEIPEIETNISPTQPDIDYHDTPEGIVEAIKRGLQYEKELDAGLHKEKTLLELLDEED